MHESRRVNADARLLAAATLALTAVLTGQGIIFRVPALRVEAVDVAIEPLFGLMRHPWSYLNLEGCPQDSRQAHRPVRNGTLQSWLQRLVIAGID
jgi:hypothetical protein